jgi:tellurite resistance protein TerC
MFFLVIEVMNRFHYLKLGLAFLLGFVGVKMLAVHLYKISTNYSLMIIASILALSMIASLVRSAIQKRSL